MSPLPERDLPDFPRSYPEEMAHTVVFDMDTTNPTTDRRWLMGEYSYQEVVTVHASPEVVWNVLSHVEAWPSWTESVRAVSRRDPAPLRVGSQIRISQPRLPAMTWTIDQLEPGRSFSWTTRSTGVSSVADHRIDTAAEGCRVTLEVRQRGPAAALSRLLFDRLTQRYLQMEARGLKRQAESEA